MEGPLGKSWTKKQTILLYYRPLDKTLFDSTELYLVSIHKKTGLALFFGYSFCCLGFSSQSSLYFLPSFYSQWSIHLLFPSCSYALFLSALQCSQQTDRYLKKKRTCFFLESYVLVYERSHPPLISDKEEG